MWVAAELLGSEIALMAAGFAGLAITTIAIFRDLSVARARTTSAQVMPAQRSAVRGSAD